MPEQLWFTEILNRLFGSSVTAFLRAVHIEPKHAQAPIANSLAMELLVFFLLVALFMLLRSRLSVDSPNGLQHSFEAVEGFVLDQSHEIIGPHSEPYTSFFAILFIFILLCNLIGLIPGFESPTGVPVVPLGCAICAFVYYHAQGFKHSGVKYLLHFFGPPGFLASAGGAAVLLFLLIDKAAYNVQIFQQHGPLLVLGMILFLFGLQVLAVGLVGELLTRTHFEGHDKPIYRIERIVGSSRVVAARHL